MDSPASHRSCRVCLRQDRRAIETAMATMPPVAVGAEFGLDERVIKRHFTHLGNQVVATVEREAKSHSRLVIETIRNNITEAQRLGALAEELGDVKTALAALRESTRSCEVWAKLTMAATLMKTAPVGPNAPPWGKLSTDEKRLAAREMVSWFTAYEQKLEAELVLSGDARMAIAEVMREPDDEGDDEVLT
jgi:hypothetical protein